MASQGYVRRAASIVMMLTLAIITLGCDEPSMPPPKLGVQNWKPSPVGGPLEVRQLPPATTILKDYDQWLEANTAHVARVYESVLVGSSNQMAFTIEVSRDETPVGRPEHTFVSFVYNDRTNGPFKYTWHRLGRHKADFLKVGNRETKLWSILNREASKNTMPILQIVAIEGMEADGVLLALPGGVRK